MAVKDAEVAKREAAIHEEQEKLLKEKESIEEQVSAKLKVERDRITIEEVKKARLLAATDLEQKTKELSDLQQVLKEREGKLAEAQQAQADLIRKQRELEVHPGQMLGDTTLPSVAGLDLQAIDEIDHIVEAPAGTGSDAASGNGDGKVCLASTGAADQHGVTLLGDEASAGEIIDQRLIDRCAFELEVLHVLGKRQLCDGELVLDRAGLLLVDLGVEQVADNALRFVLALDGGCHDLVEGRLRRDHGDCHQAPARTPAHCR